MMDCDKIITVSKLKTHGMAMYTGAVKIMFGAIPGVLKAEYHYKMPDLKDFTNMLVDICTLTKPVLSIIDGVVGMEGEGPTGGNPIHSGVILASENPYNLDVVGAYAMGIKPHDVPTIQRCMERGLTTGNIKDIQIVGDSIDAFKKTYKVPDIRTIRFANKVPKFVEQFLNKNVLPRPVFSQEICIGCSSCKKSCPPGAITMVDGKPRVDLDKCIRCFCCQELCPQKAVEIKRPWILRRILDR
jgi:ferredoxin